MESFRSGPSGQRVCTISGLRIEVTSFGQLEIGHSVVTPDEAERVADAIRDMAAHAREVRRKRVALVRRIDREL